MVYFYYELVIHSRAIIKKKCGWDICNRSKIHSILVSVKSKLQNSVNRKKKFLNVVIHVLYKCVYMSKCA